MAESNAAITAGEEDRVQGRDQPRRRDAEEGDIPRTGEMSEASGAIAEPERRMVSRVGETRSAKAPVPFRGQGGAGVRT